jgi:starvation-inducible DNA-binding protein
MEIFMEKSVTRSFPKHKNAGQQHRDCTIQPMYPTKNTLNEQIRFKSINLLQERLAEGIDVMLQTKQAHWNVKGESFYSMHKLFDKINGESGEWVDLIAERLVQLGGIAEGTIQSVSGRSKINHYPLNISRGLDHATALSKSLAQFGEKICRAIEQAGEFGDADTADVFTEISRGVDTFIWMVEAHLQDNVGEGAAVSKRSA